MLPNRHAIDAAVLARLTNDATLKTLAPHGVWFDEARGAATQFVIVSIVDTLDVDTFEGRVLELVTYRIDYRELRSATGAGHAAEAAARIDALLHGTTLTATGYAAGVIYQLQAHRTTEPDDVDPAIRWDRRGGDYRAEMSLP